MKTSLAVYRVPSLIYREIRQLGDSISHPSLPASYGQNSSPSVRNPCSPTGPPAGPWDRPGGGGFSPSPPTHLVGDTTSKQKRLSRSSQGFTVHRRKSSTTTVGASWAREGSPKAELSGWPGPRLEPPPEGERSERGGAAQPKEGLFLGTRMGGPAEGLENVSQ